MKKNYPLIRPLVGDAECEAVARVIRSGWLTQGTEVRHFEEEFASYVGAKHAIAVSNCTVALHLALKVLGVSQNDEVLTVSHSFIATANSIRHCGATPIFVDICPDTMNIDPRLVERNLSFRTKAILVVHQMGMPCDLTSVIPIARKHRIPIVEDAACAIGSEIKWNGQWEKIGKPHGDLACFSFHPRKLLTTGDGGMITTSNSEFESRLRLLRQHGMSMTDIARHSAQSVVFEEYLELGYNSRMTDVQAAIGREQLKRLDGVISRRTQQVDIYRQGFSTIPSIQIPTPPGSVKTNWQSFWIRLPDGTNQRDFMTKALEQGITTRRGILCAHREPAFKKEPWSCRAGECHCNCKKGCQNLRESERAQDQCVILPLYHDMTIEDQSEIVSFVKNYFETQFVSDKFDAKAA